jgi:hypothetical protein
MGILVEIKHVELSMTLSIVVDTATSKSLVIIVHYEGLQFCLYCSLYFK